MGWCTVILSRAPFPSPPLVWHWDLFILSSLLLASTEILLLQGHTKFFSLAEKCFHSSLIHCCLCRPLDYQYEWIKLYCSITYRIAIDKHTTSEIRVGQFRSGNGIELTILLTHTFDDQSEASIWCGVMSVVYVCCCCCWVDACRRTNAIFSWCSASAIQLRRRNCAMWCVLVVMWEKLSLDGLLIAEIEENKSNGEATVIQHFQKQ